MDSDDFIHPRFYETLMRLIDQGADIAVCEKLRVDDSYIPNKEFPAVEKISEYDSDNALSTALIKNCIWNRLYKKSILQNIYFAEEVTFAEDVTFNICVVAKNPSLIILTTDIPLYYYYMRDQSLTHTVQTSQVIQRGEYFLKEIDHVLDPRAKWLYLDAAYKSVFAYRYSSRFTPLRIRHEASAYSKRLLRHCHSVMRSLHVKPALYWRYYIMAKVPPLYRAYRIITDPTMLQWEKVQKEAMKEEKNRKGLS